MKDELKATEAPATTAAVTAAPTTRKVSDAGTGAASASEVTTSTSAATTKDGRSRRKQAVKEDQKTKELATAPRVQPTSEFLKREGDKLAAAASAVKRFLLPSEPAAPANTDDTVTQQPFVHTVQLAEWTGPGATRPRHEKAGTAKGRTTKETVGDIRSLLGHTERSDACR